MNKKGGPINAKNERVIGKGQSNIIRIKFRHMYTKGDKKRVFHISFGTLFLLSRLISLRLITCPIIIDNNICKCTCRNMHASQFVNQLFSET